MSDLTMQLPTEIVERAVRDKINAAIAKQLGDPEEMITKLVSSALSAKVNAHGVVSKSSYDNKYDFLDVMMGNFIRDAAKEALNEYLDEQKPKIKDAVQKEIARSPSKLAKVFVDGITRSMQSNYHASINISFDSKD